MYPATKCTQRHGIYANMSKNLLTFSQFTHNILGVSLAGMLFSGRSIKWVIQKPKFKAFSEMKT